MNKGLERRNKKLKRNTIKPDQENLCRFVTIKYQVIDRVNGKYKHNGANTVNGLQIRNRVYLINGSYKLINNKGTRVMSSFKDIPEWATEDLIEKYNKFLSKKGV